MCSVRFRVMCMVVRFEWSWMGQVSFEFGSAIKFEFRPPLLIGNYFKQTQDFQFSGSSVNLPLWRWDLALIWIWLLNRDTTEVCFQICFLRSEKEIKMRQEGIKTCESWDEVIIIIKRLTESNYPVKHQI